MSSMKRSRRVLFLEFNELTYTIIDRLIDAGKLPNFAKLKREGTWAAPEAIERPPLLDPWITWVTVHTGVDAAQHGAYVLEQDSSTIRAKRSWHYVMDAGKSVGVFGSISAYPPRPVPGFMIPGPFAPSNETYPPYVSPVQALNRKYTQVHQKNEQEDTVFDMIKRGVDLVSLGLKPSTVARIAKQLAQERFAPHLKYRRVCLQPYINFDFFQVLYERYKPDFATWHTNHCAHYMHHYWRAWDDSQFLSPASPEEKKHYGDAIEFGYGVADDLLGKFMKLIDDDTVLVLATSLGQQPYVKDMYKDGKLAVRFKSFSRFLELVGADGATDLVPTMIPQWNVRYRDADKRAKAISLIEGVRCVGGTHERGLAVEQVGDMLTITPLGLAKKEGDIRYFFDNTPGARAEGYPIDELFAVDTPTPKEGYHDPKGVLMIWGHGVSRGAHIPDTTNLDILPTMLTMMGIAVPEIMKGRVLSEAMSPGAWADAPRVPARGGSDGAARAAGDAP
jgi:predicted AlkP superfamily phosphohydrolase/phosphomutase